ncbi:MAG TPA: hypothetical protein VLN49_23765 [Gemmatimonadaceae bacterium]|nr:hypothetical protein [Gemmatimonadaceae bacterium]
MRAIGSEFQRLGLRANELPGGGLAVQDWEAFLRFLQTFEPPVTWRDVFPDLPSHWLPGRPETWTTRYRPLGPYDHQSLPTGPAIHVEWPRTTDPSCLDGLIGAARAAGWPVYGGGFVDINDPDWPTLDAIIVLDAGTVDARLDDFLEWLDQRSDVSLAAVPRRGNEQYVPDF